MDNRAHTVDFLHVIHEGETIILTEGPALPFGGTRDMAGLCGVVERVNEILAITHGTTIVVSLEYSSMMSEGKKRFCLPHCSDSSCSRINAGGDNDNTPLEVID